MYGDCEPVDIYNERPVVARKKHKCCACDETIAIGHRYYRISIVWDGTAETIKRCLRCQAIHVHLRSRRDRCDEWPSERLDCGETYEDVFDESPPDDIAALAFATQDQMQTATVARATEGV